MKNNRLNIVAVSEAPAEKPLPSRTSRKKELQAQFERQWLLNAEQFNPSRNCMERERLERTWSLLCGNVDFANKIVVDIGCAAGIFSRRMRDAGAEVDAVDISENALKHLNSFNMDRIRAIQDAMPMTSLEDGRYNLAVCMEVIADLPKDDHRIFFSELNRLIKPTGRVLFSTGIDIYSQGGLEKLLELIQTEFDLVASIYSYHRSYIRLKELLEAPSKFVQAWKNQDFRQTELKKRKGLSKGWFRLNSLIPFVWAWVPIQFLLSPLIHWFKQSRFILLQMEKISHFWNPDEPSHVIFLLKRRPLQHIQEDQVPIQRPHKREVWE